MLDTISAILPYVVLFGTAIPSIVFHEVAHGYAALAQRWRTLIPLTPVLVVADAADS